MSHEIRLRNIKASERLLDAALAKVGSVKVWEFISAIKLNLGVREETAKSYWEDSIKHNQKYDQDGFSIWVRGKKPERMG